MRTLAVVVFSSALLLLHAQAQATNETLLSTENAYNPIPSPDGKYIAYVRTGWGRPGGSGGFGRSNLVSDAIAMDASGRLATRTPLCDEFLAGWTWDSRHVVCFRDGRYMVASLDAPMPEEKHLPTYGEPTGTERVSYANSSGRAIWTRRLESGDSVVESADGVIARHNGWLGELIAPSPDGRYISVAGAWTGSHIWVYDIELKKWTDIGEIDIHPNSDWDYIKASWNPWFGDSSRLAFFTHNHKVLSVVVPDGTKRINIQVARNAGLAAPSLDGQFIAYVTFEPHPMKLRPDLNFWGGTQVWVVPVAEQAQPISVTQTSPDETCSLRWLDDRTLVFDRIAEVGFYKQARIWKAQVPR